MGKCIKRTISKTSDKNIFLKRDDALIKIVKEIRKGICNENTYRLISLFGITSEELAENGIAYEDIVNIDKRL